MRNKALNDNALRKYYDEYVANIEPDWLFKDLNKFKDLLENTSNLSGKAIFGGNGASAAIASHAALDFTK